MLPDPTGTIGHMRTSAAATTDGCKVPVGTAASSRGCYLTALWMPETVLTSRTARVMASKIQRTLTHWCCLRGLWFGRPFVKVTKARNYTQEPFNLLHKG